MVPGKIDNEKKGSSNNLSFQLVADQKFLAKKQEIKDLGSMMKKRNMTVKDESIKKRHRVHKTISRRKRQLCDYL